MEHELEKSSVQESLFLRVASAAIMVPVGLAVVWLGEVVLLVATAIVGLLMWHEYWTVCTKEKGIHPAWIVSSSGLIGMLICYWGLPDGQIVAVVIPLIISTILMAFICTRKFIPLTIGLVLIGLAILALNIVRSETFGGLTLTIAAMICVWSTDIAAYFAGRGFGGPQLSPSSSPNKTWSGAAGAIVCSALIGAFIAGIVQGTIWSWVIFAIAISLIGQSGDLLQSIWKRHYGVKDSGNIIPGHGGVLDRLDAFSAVLFVLAGVLMVWPSFPVRFLGIDS